MIENFSEDEDKEFNLTEFLKKKKAEKEKEQELLAKFSEATPMLDKLEQMNRDQTRSIYDEGNLHLGYNPESEGTRTLPFEFTPASGPQNPRNFFGNLGDEQLEKEKQEWKN